jgi:hypothetical protein
MQSLVRAMGGKWSVSYKFEPDETNPKGSTGEGEANWSRRIDTSWKKNIVVLRKERFSSLPFIGGIKAQIVFAACFALTPAPLSAMWMRTTTAP